LNTASSSGFISISSSNLAVVNATGNVYLVLSVSSVQTRCKMYVFYFPFDVQNCSIIIGSWQLETTRIDFFSGSDKITLSSYTPNPVWALRTVSVASIFNSDRYISYSNYQNEDISFNFLLKRGSSFYMVSLPVCFVLNVVTLAAFYVPLPLQVNICKFDVSKLIKLKAFLFY